MDPTNKENGEMFQPRGGRPFNGRRKHYRANPMRGGHMPAHARSMQVAASLDAQPPALGMGVHDRLGKRDNRRTSVLMVDGLDSRVAEFYGLPHDAHATLMRFLRDFVNYKSRAINSLDGLVLMTMMHSKKYDEENLKTLLAFIDQSQAFDVVSTIFKNMNIAEPERNGLFVTKVVVFVD